MELSRTQGTKTATVAEGENDNDVLHGIRCANDNDTSGPVNDHDGRQQEPPVEGDDSPLPVRDVRPIKYGSATPPNPSTSTKFDGRGGVWTCENCSERAILSPNTKRWDCRKCRKTMFTHPKDECPLDTFCPCCCWDTILGGKYG